MRNDIKNESDGKICTLLPMLLSIFFIISSLSSRGQNLPSIIGKIKGTVVDETGRPVANAFVSIDLQDGRPKAMAVPETLTDRDGAFLFENLNFGPYRVFAWKEDAGYPNSHFSLYNHSRSTAPVTLTPSKPTADLIVRVGPKAAVVAGSITDAKTNSPLSATFILRRTAAPNDYVSLQQVSPFKLLVPSNEDISIEVSAQGYKLRHFITSPAQNSSGQEKLQLYLDQDNKLDIQLQPE